LTKRFRGNEKDIKPFIDPKFQNNVILTGTEFLTMNTRPQNPANARNLNCCIIGSSGSGKTRFWLTPNLLQAHSSFCVVDPKGGILGQVGTFLQKQDSRIQGCSKYQASQIKVNCNSLLLSPSDYRFST
jgi:type IV secretion system protein VirD4